MELTPGRLLVVDDVEANRDLLARRLRQLGHAVVTVDGGAAALAAVENEVFDIVLLDIMMPGIDGYEVLARLQADPARRHIPVIMISAVDEMASVVRCIEMGATDYMPKPFNTVLLKARVSATLEKKRLRDQERLYARSLERELEIGREIQASFLPETLPQTAGWEIAASFRPARQVAGDFYDAFELSSGRLGLVIADVCGKGVGAALFMALFRSLIRSSADLEESAPVSIADPPERAAFQVKNAAVRTNDYIARTHGSANMFATVFFGILDPRSGVLTYVNAGHEPPVVRSASGALRRLPPTGPALGLLPDRSFEIGRAALEPGDLLYAFTDGVTDARNTEGHPFGEERLLALFDPPASAAALLARIDETLSVYGAGAESFDDVAMLALERTA
jgi:serine phosphatase RsbU (regulator of sigma subunit)